MARKPKPVPHLLDRDGRYFARLAVPADLRSVVRKRELLEPLGADRRNAIARLHGAVDRFQRVLADARQGLAPRPPAISIPHAVHTHYRAELAHDDHARFAATEGVVRPADHNALLATAYLHALRRVAGGFVTEDEAREGFVEAAKGWAIDAASEGKARPARGSAEYMALARALAMAQVEAAERSREREEGDFRGQPAFDLLKAPPPKPEQETAPVSIGGLFDDYIAILARSGKGSEAARRWRPVFADLVAFLKHDDARTVARADVRGWIEHLRETRGEKTIKDSYLGAARAVFSHAFDNELIPTNPTQGVRIKLGRAIEARDKGFAPDEALAVLRASRSYQPKPSDNPATREGHQLVAAKRWIPLLCALTGARVAEMAQLRKEDIREEGGIRFLVITPEAGSVKTGQYRDVPLHRQLIEAGFLDFVSQSESGPLFYRVNPGRAGKTHPSKAVTGRISQWLGTCGLVPAGVKPNHGWRHAFKTIGIEAGLEARVIDAIQGHAPRTAGEAYGRVSLKAKAAALERFPNFEVDRSVSS